MRRTVVLEGVDHGTITAYVLGCGCTPCREKKRTYTNQLKLKKQRGLSGRVDGPVIRTLAERQMKRHRLASVNELVRASGVSARVVRNILKAEAGTYFHRRTFLAIRYLPHLGEAIRMVPSTGSAIRLEAAAAIGWGEARKRVFDPALSSRSTLRDRGTSKMKIDTAQRIVDWLKLAMESPDVNNTTAKHARARGWKPPSAYDIDLLLDPLWDGVGGLLADQAELKGKELWADFLHLRETGVKEDDALERVGRDKHWMRAGIKRYGGYTPARR